MSDQPPGQDALRNLAETLWEELGGDLCICQRPDVPHWCEKCQDRIDLIASRWREAAAALSEASSPSGAWQPVVGYEGRYEVTRGGVVRASDGRVLKQWANDQGYMLVRVSGPRAVLRVHRIVAEAFVPNPQALPFVNHIDCCPANNLAENLEWCTQAENLRHSDALGRMQRDYWKGKRSPNASLDDEQVRAIRAAYEAGRSLQAVAGMFGVSKRCVGRIIKREVYADVL